MVLASHEECYAASCMPQQSKLLTGISNSFINVSRVTLIKYSSVKTADVSARRIKALV